jgi:acyl-CoA thioester hydrolase
MSEDPSAGRFDGKAHLLPIRIYYEDTDFTGLVYHANYLRYFERGRSDYLRLAGVDHTVLLQGDSPTAFTLTRIALDFVKPARIDDALTIRTVYEAVEGPRMLIAQTALRAEETLARAEVVAVCISMEGRAKRPPPALMEKLRPLLMR